MTTADSTPRRSRLACMNGSAVAEALVTREVVSAIVLMVIVHMLHGLQASDVGNAFLMVLGIWLGSIAIVLGAAELTPGIPAIWLMVPYTLLVAWVLVKFQQMNWKQASIGAVCFVGAKIAFHFAWAAMATA